MRLTKTAAGLLGIPAVLAATALFSGCFSTGPTDAMSDEFARISSQEVSNMSANSSTMVGSTGLAKAPAAADTIYYDWKIRPYTWDAASGSYVRTATVTCSDGYERVRIDTLTFLDAGNTSLRHPTLATVKTIKHIRNVTREKGGNELNIRVAMNSQVNLSPDTTHVKNGTITGTYNNDRVVGTGTITNVTRRFTNGRWQFPRSGTISVNFPRRSYEADFLGNGDAQLTITNAATKKTSVVTIHVDER